MTNKQTIVVDNQWVLKQIEISRKRLAHIPIKERNRITAFIITAGKPPHAEAIKKAEE